MSVIERAPGPWPIDLEVRIGPMPDPPSPATRGGLIGAARDIWRYRELLRHLTIRNLKVKYKRSLLGFVWTLLNPLLTVAALVAVFGYIVRIELPAYWAFLISGYFVWNFMSMVMAAGTKVLGEHAALARSVRVPEQVFVLGAVGARLIEFLLELALCILALVLFLHGGVPTSFAVLPLLILCQALLATAFALPIATLSAFFDDVQHGLPVVLLVLFYVSPVFYPVSLVPETVSGPYLLNPIARLLTAFQAVLYEGRVPPVADLGLLLLISCIAAALGLTLFARKRAMLAEVL